MARYGVLADIHGNREALEAALAVLDRRDVRRLLCLGDIVGYNADPDECADMLRRRGALAIAGNHDLIGTGHMGFERCSNNAAYALRRTRRLLGAQTAEWLESLPSRLAVDRDVVLVHGGVRDVQLYMKTDAQIRQNAEFLRADFPGARLCFFGHSHEQRVFEVFSEIRTLQASGTVLLNRDNLYLVNPGSVDAQRKNGDKQAEFAILDTLDWSVEFMRVRYDSAATEAKAAVYGYRIGPWTNRFYSLRRRLLHRL
jgi:predicted phosphodiesterase